MASVFPELGKELRLQLIAAREAVESMGPDLPAMHQAVESMGPDLPAMHQAVESMGPDLPAMHQAVESMGPDLPAMHQAVESMGPDLPAMHQAVESMGPDLPAMHQAVESMGPDLPAMHQAVESMGPDLPAMHQAVESMGPDLPAMHQAVESMGPDLPAMHQAVESMGPDLPAMHQAVESMGPDLSAMHQAVAAMGPDLSAMHQAALMVPDLSAFNRAVPPAKHRDAAEVASLNIPTSPPAYSAPLRSLHEVPHLSFRSAIDRAPETAREQIGNDESSTRRQNRAVLLDLDIPLCSVQLRASYQGDSSDLMATHLLKMIERSLRVFLVERLQLLYGPRWFERCVPSCLLKRWKLLEERDGSRYPIIQYSGFMDLLKVITYPDNWKSVFQSTFREIEDIRVSFGRLLPIRNHIAHNRDLSKEDQFTLIVETYRILGQMGYPVIT